MSLLSAKHMRDTFGTVSCQDTPGKTSVNNLNFQLKFREWFDLFTSLTAPHPKFSKMYVNSFKLRMENKLFTVRFRFSKHANFGDFTWLFVQNGQSHKTHEPNVLLTETFDSPRPRYSRRRGLLHVFRNTITIAKLNTRKLQNTAESLVAIVRSL